MVLVKFTSGFPSPPRNSIVGRVLTYRQRHGGEAQKLREVVPRTNVGVRRRGAGNDLGDESRQRDAETHLLVLCGFRSPSPVTRPLMTAALPTVSVVDLNTALLPRMWVNAAVISGLVTATASGNRTAQQVGLGVALAGFVTKIISGAATPDADIRSWDNLPQFLSFAAVPLPVGQHTATIEFLGGDGKPLVNLTKTITVNVTTTERDKVVFVSDISTTPQTL